MDLNQLEAMGAFVAIKPVKKVLNVEHPEYKPRDQWLDQSVPEFTGEVVTSELTVFIRKGMAYDAIEMSEAERGSDRAMTAIFRAVCADASGNPYFKSAEDVRERLPGWASWPIMQAITEVNSGPKSSRRKTNGASKPASLTASPKQS